VSRYHVTRCRDRTAALEEEKEVDKKMMKRNVGMVFSSFFSPLPINKGYFVQFLNANTDTSPPSLSCSASYTSLRSSSSSSSNFPLSLAFLAYTQGCIITVSIIFDFDSCLELRLDFLSHDSFKNGLEPPLCKML